MKYLLIAILLTLSSCEMFSTREPEEPNVGSSNYLPPTSYDIVVENLKNSIKEKNLTNYLSIFADSSKSELPQYRYIPDAQNQSQNNAVFENWNVNSEEKYFSSMFSSVIEQTTPSITFVEEEFQTYSDSIIYSAEYYLDFEFTNDLSDNTYSGSIRLVLKDTDSGFWYITSWYDYIRDNQENSFTWSYLKSRYYL